LLRLRDAEFGDGSKFTTAAANAVASTARA
jgi:hypothetical protein